MQKVTAHSQAQRRVAMGLSAGTVTNVVTQRLSVELLAVVDLMRAKGIKIRKGSRKGREKGGKENRET